jgi:hypothetical protein
VQFIEVCTFWFAIKSHCLFPSITTPKRHSSYYNAGTI